MKKLDYIFCINGLIPSNSISAMGVNAGTSPSPCGVGGRGRRCKDVLVVVWNAHYQCFVSTREHPLNKRRKTSYRETPSNECFLEWSRNVLATKQTRARNSRYNVLHGCDLSANGFLIKSTVNTPVLVRVDGLVNTAAS